MANTAVSKAGIRAAQSGDSADAAGLVFSSGPVAFNHIFNCTHGPDIRDFLADQFAKAATMFSYRHHYVYEQAGQVIATIAGFDKPSHNTTFIGNAKAIFSHYGWRGIVKGLRFEMSLVKPPRKRCYYLCHIAVDPQWRGRGIAAQLINFMAARAKAQGYSVLSLDVAESNAAALHLYQQMGFKIVKCNRSYNGILDNHLYMEMSLIEGVC
ncbi:MAG: GNAT family N-acetyltransferase [Zhongshania sp.]|uniref:GNAT family N-acetyltransferase n=1 Tax=Zhongshania sp. TaxID=1971902 RepID=UPI00261B4CC2|nr:GNAT family N-acetyltransferase [Zhongshania sp.]MDF1690884.1 GNAT family N-acetyltransferase [Zhongshania sp.]